MIPDGWIMKVMLFADGDHGAATQVHMICNEKSEPTGILMVWSRKNRTDSGARRFFYKDASFSEIDEAYRLWQGDGSKVGVDQTPKDVSIYLRKAPP